jgi:transcriptional regulator with XRE-family HTH domain
MVKVELLTLLGNRVRHFREQYGWSQEELARRCERHFTYIGRIERGQQNITVEVLHDVAVALGVSITNLLVDEDHPLLSAWKVSAMDIIQAVSHGFRAQVDVKGKLAEWMLFNELSRLQQAGSIQKFDWLDADDKPDFIVKAGANRVAIECKNVRSRTANQNDHTPIRVELQKTRNARDGSNTRGYQTDHFDVLSACLFNRTGRWDFRHVAINKLATRPNDPSCLKIMHVVPAEAESPWHASLLEAIRDRRP